MAQYIDKSALVAEINKLTRKNELYLDDNVSDAVRFQKTGAYSVLCYLQHFLDTIEVKDANEALRTEYEKGRADIIEKTLKWLWDLNQEHEIMSYTDSRVLSSDELQQYYKNNIEQ